MDTTGTKDFVLYSEVSFDQGVIVDHAPLTIVANCRSLILTDVNGGCG